MKKEYEPNSLGVVKHGLETWTGGTANGYFEPATGEIHILEGAFVELRSIWHEETHRARQNRISFKLARLQRTPAFINMLFLAIILTAVSKALTGLDFFLLTALMLSGIFAVIAGCQAYEERQAILAVTQKSQEFKRYRGEVPK